MTTDTGDETLGAGLDHGGQVIVEPGVGAARARHAEVDRGQLADPQAAEVGFDARAQLTCVVAAVAEDPDLADDRQLGRVGVERFADQVVDHVRAVVLGGVDVIDSG
jgi:hypothetical protein